MRTALDTNIRSSMWLGAPSAATIAAQLSRARAEGALAVSAPVFAELTAMPAVNGQLIAKLLGELSIAIDSTSAKMSGGRRQPALPLIPFVAGARVEGR